MTGMTLVVTLLLAIIGFVALTNSLAKLSKELWSKGERYQTLVVWIVYAVVLGSAYGESVWEELEPHRWREWRTVIIALVFLLALILYAVTVVRGTDDGEGLGLGRPGRAAERLVKRLLARWRAKPDTADRRGPKGK